MRIRRTPRFWLAALLLSLGCTSIEGPPVDSETWQVQWRDRSQRWAAATADGAGAAARATADGAVALAAATGRGAVAVGGSLATAYRGVRHGFQEPGADSFGPEPLDYAETIRKHMTRFEGVPEGASFAFAKPERAYLNQGLLRGGEIEWRGWVVDVSIATEEAFGRRATSRYAVRMNRGEVVEVLEAEYASALRRPDAAPAAPAD